jgi:hypothetical protein
MWALSASIRRHLFSVFYCPIKKLYPQPLKSWKNPLHGTHRHLDHRRKTGSTSTWEYSWRFGYGAVSAWSAVLLSPTMARIENISNGSCCIEIEKIAEGCMTPRLRIAAIDAAMAIEEKLIHPKAGIRDVTVDPNGHINTWAHGSVPPKRKEQIVGCYDARASAEQIAEDLLAVPEFREAHA